MAGNDDDFTFCQVGPRVEGVGTQKVADSGNGICIDDRNTNAEDNRSGNLNVASIWKFVDSIGSPTFSVVDESSNKEVEQRSKQDGQEVPGSSNNALPQTKAPMRKPTVRAKVPYQIGHSQMDWVKLTRTHPDLAGLKGQSNGRLVSLNEVKQHRSEGSMWTVLKGRVYNIAPYMKFHPGGEEELKKAVGKDCTSLFNKYHSWVNADFLLEKCLVGILDVGQ